MNLIEELKNYCDINNPVGALMLSVVKHILLKPNLYHQ